MKCNLGGYADGTPKSHEDFYALVAQADAKLYEIKHITHSPEFGGHDRRMRK